MYLKIYIINAPEEKIDIDIDANYYKGKYYTYEYLLDKNNSLFLNDKIKIALGQALTTSPKEKTITTTLCKHAYACVQYLVKNYSNLMKTI